MENQNPRFSLWTLMIVLTISSLLLAVFTAFADAWATGTLIVFLQIVPLTLLLGIVWGGRYVRVFCIGAIIPAGLTLATLAPIWIISMFTYSVVDDPLAHIGEMLLEFSKAHRVIAALSWIFTVLMGLIAVALRRWVFRGG